MCKHKNQKFIGENTGPNPLYWCENCGVFINGEYIKLLKLINKLVETTNEQPERIEKCGCPYNKCFC